MPSNEADDKQRRSCTVPAGERVGGTGATATRGRGQGGQGTRGRAGDARLEGEVDHDHDRGDHADRDCGTVRDEEGYDLVARSAKRHATIFHYIDPELSAEAVLADGFEPVPECMTECELSGSTEYLVKRRIVLEGTYRVCKNCATGSGRMPTPPTPETPTGEPADAGDPETVDAVNEVGDVDESGAGSGAESESGVVSIVAREAGVVAQARSEASGSGAGSSASAVYSSVASTSASVARVREDGSRAANGGERSERADSETGGLDATR